MNFNEFKKVAADFFKLVKTMNKPEQVENGFKILAISYLQMVPANPNESHQARILLEMASKKQDEILFAQLGI